MKAVLSYKSEYIFTCQAISRLEVKSSNTFGLPKDIRGKRNESTLVTEFNLQQSTQKCSVPSFFFAKTTGLAQGLHDSWITADSCIEFNSVATS